MPRALIALRQGDGGVGPRAKRAVALDPARKAQSERINREFQWPPTPRMPQRALDFHSAARTYRDRNLATGIQRGTTEEDPGRSDAGRLCPTTRGQSRYDQIWTLKGPATEIGGTSAPAQGPSRFAKQTCWVQKASECNGKECILTCLACTWSITGRLAGS